MAGLERLLRLLSAFEVVVRMTDGWLLYEARLKGKLHVISKRYTLRIERHNQNLRHHVARLGRKSLLLKRTEKLLNKVIGNYLTINHYQQIGVIMSFLSNNLTLISRFEMALREKGSELILSD